MKHNVILSIHCVRSFCAAFANIDIFTQVITALDYLEILSELAENDTTTQQLTEYICQTAVLHSEFGVYPQAKLSAGCVLLARIFRHKGI